MKMKSLFGVILAAGLLSAGSASAAELKIGFVDVKSAVENTKAYQQGLKRLEALTGKKQKELDALRAKIEQSEKDMLGQSMAMSPERLSQKQSELKELRKLYTRKQQDAQEELLGEKNKLDQGVVTKFYRVVDSYGKNNGFDLIMPKAQQLVLYGNPAHDVTADITKLLDQ